MMPRLRRIGLAIKIEDFARRMTPTSDATSAEDMDGENAVRDLDSVVAALEDDRIRRALESGLGRDTVS